MSIACESCAAVVPEDEINADLGLAHCPACDAVFPVTAPPALAAPVATPVLAAASFAPPAEVRSPRAVALPIPEGMQVAENAGGLVLQHRWFRGHHVMMAAMSVFWMGFLFVWYSNALGSAGASTTLLVVPLLHVAVGVGLSYTAVAGFVNTTTITVTQGTLEVEHGPLPWIGQHRLPTSALEQLYCERVVQRTKQGERISYQVNAALRDHGEIVLVRGLGQYEEARFLEWKIEQRLGIQDRPMPGEHAKPH